jgi:hypothetical protein
MNTRLPSSSKNTPALADNTQFPAQPKGVGKPNQNHTHTQLIITMKTSIAFALLSLALSFTPSSSFAQEKQAPAKEEKHDHDHAKKAGPTGGRLITTVEPHVEFLVNKDKKIEIRFVDETNKVVAPGTQEISVTLGERAAPTKLTFTKEGDHLISDKVIPAGNDYPTVVQIKAKAGDKAVNEKFNLNLDKCPTCKFQEYNCTCDHEAEEKEVPKKAVK